MKLKRELQKLICIRCNYSWIPRKQEIRLCPKCKSAYWDKERTNIRRKK